MRSHMFDNDSSSKSTISWPLVIVGGIVALVGTFATKFIAGMLTSKK